MKKLLAFVIGITMILCFAGCGEQEQSAEAPATDSAEVALLVDGDIDDGGFNEVTWQSIQNFCSGNDITCAYYIPKGTKDEEIKETVEEAIEKDGKLIIFAGSTFETAVFDLQKEHKDINFYLIDGVPHDKDNTYELADNSIGVLFAEQEAGYLAGYAIVKDGYRNLGFMGGEDLPSVKRYGYGFLQGISAAAAEQGIEKDITIRYDYAGTFSANEEVQKEAMEWYADGTEVIFSCGGGIIKSIVKASKKEGGKIIGVDVDQSELASTVVTSAKKGIDSAIEDVLKGYNRDNFVGNNVFNYTASNGGVGLEITNARFKSFDKAQYDEIFNQIKEGSIQIKKDTEVDDIEDLVDDNIKIIK